MSPSGRASFVALDGWRGVYALVIALLHVNSGLEWYRAAMRRHFNARAGRMTLARTAVDVPSP
jgi:hypothetical protein